MQTNIPVYYQMLVLNCYEGMLKAEDQNGCCAQPRILKKLVKYFYYSYNLRSEERMSNSKSELEFMIASFEPLLYHIERQKKKELQKQK